MKLWFSGDVKLTLTNPFTNSVLTNHYWKQLGLVIENNLNTSKVGKWRKVKLNRANTFSFIILKWKLSSRYDITHFTESQHGKYGNLKMADFAKIRLAASTILDLGSKTIPTDLWIA